MATILPSLYRFQKKISEYKEKYNTPDKNSKPETPTDDEQRRLNKIIKQNRKENFTFAKIYDKTD